MPCVTQEPEKVLMQGCHMQAGLMKSPLRQPVIALEGQGLLSTILAKAHCLPVVY